MGRGSQLTQLKSALSSAGLSRKSQPGAATGSGAKKQQNRKRVAAAAARDPALEKAQKAKKLEEIRKKLNPFDVKVTKLKHDVGGRKVKGVMGRPSASKQQGLEKRRKILLPEYQAKNRAGGIVDRRFGETDSTLTPEERMLERFTKERQRASRGVDFNLEDDDELTHYGQSLSAMDDFDGTGLALGDDDDDDYDDDKHGGEPFVAPVSTTTNQGDEGDENHPDEPQRKKSKAEVMSEVIAKSKEHKYMRQLAKEQDEQIRHQMDAEFGDIRDLLFGAKAHPSSSGSNAVALGSRPSRTGDVVTSPPNDDSSAPGPSTTNSLPKPIPAAAPVAFDDEDDYDQVVRQLVFDKRAKPTDRTKTDEEIAAEEAEKLQKQERARLRRMRGELDESGSDDDDGPPRKRRREQAQADDLEDDFDPSEDGAQGENDILGPGLEHAVVVGSDHENDEDDDSVEGTAGESESSSGSDEGAPEGASPDDWGSEDSSTGDGDDASADDDINIASKQQARQREPRKKGQLPFTFPAPSSHGEFLEIIEDLDPSDTPTVVQRMRTIYHPSLAEDNKFKLQTLCSVLIEHVLHVAKPPSASLSQVGALTPHIFALSKQYPTPSAQAFVDKVILMQKNLVRGLDKGALLASSKTFPGTSELALLKLIGEVWSTSDLRHPVVTPTMLLIAQYLGQGRIRTLADIASGLFLCSITHQYHSLSGRFVPEATNFIFNALLLLAPHSLERESVPGNFPILDLEKRETLGIKTELAAKLSPNPARLSEIINWDHAQPVTQQHRVDLLAVVYSLLGQFAALYKGLEGFIELFEPIIPIGDNLEIGSLSESVQALHNAQMDSLRRLLKFAKQSRKPLMLQSHKPIPLATYAPKFDEGYSYRRRHDPDSERNAASKLRAEYKKEHKGAMRELRKDSRFLAEEQTRRQMETEAGYNSRMAKAIGSIQVERAEEKAMEREKVKAKRRTEKKK